MDDDLVSKMDEFQARKAKQHYEAAKAPLPPRRWSFWDIPFIHAILVILLVLGWLALVLWLRWR